MLPRDRRVGLEPSRADEIRAAHAPLPKATNPRDVEAFADALAILRGHDQTRWSGAPIVDPARRVVENRDLRGLGKDDLVALLGPPVIQTAHPSGAVWQYTFHDGEQGVMPRIYVTGGDTVTHVDVQYGHSNGHR